MNAEVKVTAADQPGDEQPGTELATLANIADYCEGRDRAIEGWMATYDAFHANVAVAGAASIAGSIGLAAGSDRYGDVHLTEHFLRAPGEIEVWEDRERVKKDARQRFQETITTAIDRRCWRAMMDRLGFDRFLDRQAREEFEAGLKEAPPPFTVEICKGTFGDLWLNRRDIWLRGIANVFMSMDRRFRSHDEFAIGNRLIIERAFGTESWNRSSWSRYERRDAMIDVERVFRELEGLPPLGYHNSIAEIVTRARERGDMSRIETEYFRIDHYLNGNVHFWFTRKDLLKQVNELLLEYYKPVEGDVGDGPSYESAPGYYRTPANNFGEFFTSSEIAERLISEAGVLYGRTDCSGRVRDEWAPLRVLEPSAGNGALALAARAKGHDVTCIEIQPKHAAALRGLGFTTIEGDFLRMEPARVGQFDAVVMNPPFDRGRDCDHVRHAFQMLKPGGTLIAIMSARAEFATDARHKALHALEAECSRYDGFRWIDLPERSFAHAGTNVNTVMLRLRKKAAA